MKRRWFQFRLRTLFMLVTLAAVVTGVVQHVWFVRGRIGYHQGKVAACEVRLAIKVNVNAVLLRRNTLSRIRSEQTDQVLPKRRLFYFPRGMASSIQPPDELLHELWQEMSRVEEAQRHHRRQLDLYRRATWRPWMRVAEDQSRELPDEPAKAAPTPTDLDHPDVQLEKAADA